MVFALVGFDCYMRPGELLSIKTDDVALEGDPRLERSFKLLHTKTGLNQSTCITHLMLSHYFVVLWRMHVNQNVNQFRNAFNKARSTLNLSAHFVLHSLRHG
jgi:integrase